MCCVSVFPQLRLDPMSAFSRKLLLHRTLSRSGFTSILHLFDLRKCLLNALFLLACVVPQISYAQKSVKDIRAAIKAKKPAEALRLIEKQKNDTLSSCNARIYYLGVKAAKLLSENENERIYLQQKPDTAAYFQSIHTIFTYALLTDSAETSELKSSSKHPSHRHELNRLLNRFYPNLAAAVHFFARKSDWDKARRFAQQALEARNSGIFSNEHPANISQQQLVSNAEQFLYASFAAGQYKDAEHYAELALQDSSKRSSILETLALVNAANKNAKGYRFYLQCGVDEYPQHLFFFKSLSEDLFAHKDYQAVVELSNRLIDKDPSNGLFPLTAAQAYDNLKQHDLSIRASEQALACDSTLFRAHLYIGRAYCRKARAIQLPLSIRSTGYKEALEQQKDFYLKARPHLEVYRSRASKDIQEWQPLLYEVYLKLNLGKEFEAISQIGNPHKS